jgi:hypothetical protein
MKALVVFESMFGSTHALAQSIAEGLRPYFDVEVVRVDNAGVEQLATVDLLVAGAPTHAHTLSTEASRHNAAVMSADPDGDLHLDEPEMSEGLREWLDSLRTVPAHFAAFDTRTDVPRILSGASSVRIGKELRKKGSIPVVPPESFLVTKFAGLKDGELKRGLAWGEEVALAASEAQATR